jgi:hypothetical protein
MVINISKKVIFKTLSPTEEKIVDIFGTTMTSSVYIHVQKATHTISHKWDYSTHVVFTAGTFFHFPLIYFFSHTLLPPEHSYPSPQMAGVSNLCFTSLTQLYQAFLDRDVGR